jgi:hypothetical protein
MTTFPLFSRSPATPLRSSPKKAATVTALATPPLPAVIPTAEPVSPVRLPDWDPGVKELEFFTAEEVDHMRSLKSRLDAVLDNEDNISVRWGMGHAGTASWLRLCVKLNGFFQLVGPFVNQSLVPSELT